MNVLKGFIGIGVLTMPIGTYLSGYLAIFIVYPIVALLMVYCSFLLMDVTE